MKIVYKMLVIFILPTVYLYNIVLHRLHTASVDIIAQGRSL